jgi:hypothetical protein
VTIAVIGVRTVVMTGVTGAMTVATGVPARDCCGDKLNARPDL